MAYKNPYLTYSDLTLTEKIIYNDIIKTLIQGDKSRIYSVIKLFMNDLE